MVNRLERKKLTDGFEREPFSGAAVTIKCAAGLLVVAGLAIAGPRIDAPGAAFAAAHRLPWQGNEKAWLVHAKALYQQRQIRFAPMPPGVVVKIPSANAADIRGADQNSNLNVGARPRDAEFMHKPEL